MSALVRGKSLRLVMAAPGEVRQPKWNLLFPGGDTEMFRGDFPGGSIKFDGEFFGALLSNWQKLGRPELPVDYFHDGDAVPDGQPIERKVAAGWISDMRLGAAGFEVLIRWTERAAAFIEAEELAYLSPTFSTDAADKLEGGMQGPTLYGAGLLNTPFLQQLPRVAASNSPPTTAPAATTPTKEQHMNKAICKLLGLPEDTNEEAMMTALAAKLAPPAAVADPAVVQQAAALADKAEKLLLTNTSLAATNAKLEKRLSDIEAESKATKLSALFDELRLAKKVLPSDKEAVVEMAEARGADKARAFFMGRPTLAINTTEKGNGSGEAEVVELGALKERYEAALDEKLKSGMKTHLAARELRAMAEFRPLFTTPTEKN